ncbi:MAG: hypothetical protein QQW96_04845 [Tychonema bourrellyi B0820]|uniref:DNA segregation ATPase FtsK/SpoIIIE n=1 Tax=Tychonema bourrellyi FEM_GT703 TaxID=2040638 RepID=A0A2G4EW60_9CYAN|nr:hypothetical protein [Tychonema bourrellyi]MDQ2096957.1 hypothetical protein [Tychonema bourrellyi B0820]PHX53764.1 hypothetical protein CP500_019805 [Tychonema bourrellyi FEM_GT703]
MSEEQTNQPNQEPSPSVTPEIDSTPKSVISENMVAETNAVPTPKVAVKSNSKFVATSTTGSFLEKIGWLWQSIVKLVRSLLPASLSQKLSDPILNAAIAAILLVVVGSTLNILSGKPADQIAIESPTNLPDIVAPSGSESAKFNSKLPDLVAPSATKVVETIQPPPLTPEQSLIAGIQNQVAEFTDRLGGDLVKSIQANFTSSILTVKVAEDWYRLSEVEQNQLVKKMFKEANLLNFSNLEVMNLEGKLIARNPVVGSEMIILDSTGN